MRTRLTAYATPSQPGFVVGYDDAWRLKIGPSLPTLHARLELTGFLILLDFIIWALVVLGVW